MSQCSHIKPNGEQCRSTIIVKDGLCRAHAMTPEQRSETARKMQAKRVEQIRARKRTEEDPLQNHRAVGFDKALRLAHDMANSKDVSERWAGANTLLRMTGVFDVHTLTAAQMREHLDALIPAGLREGLTPAWSGADALRAERARWYQLRRRYSPITGLYVETLPDWLVPDGMTAAEIAAQEAPDLSTATVEELNADGIAEPTHVSVRYEDGSTELVKRDAVRPPEVKVDHAEAHRLATMALDRSRALTAT